MSEEEKKEKNKVKKKNVLYINLVESRCTANHIVRFLLIEMINRNLLYSLKAAE